MIPDILRAPQFELGYCGRIDILLHKCYLAIRITEIGAEFKRVNVRAVTAGEELEAQTRNLGTGKFE